MSDQLEFCDRLQFEYPRMFPVAVQVSIDRGWHVVVEQLLNAIQAYIDSAERHRRYLLEYHPDKVKPEVEQVVIEQIKEKFGQLRVYYSGGDSYVDGLVEMAERWASVVCERCGAAGSLRTDLSWHKTLCHSHHVYQKQQRDGNMWVEP